MEEAPRLGDWLQTHSGRQFWPLDPRPEDVWPGDLAHSLSLQCRFAGHCREFYSVAQHSILAVDVAVTLGADARMQLAVLLHDAAEAYVADVPRPLKRFLAGYRAVEVAVQDAVFSRFGLALGAGEHRFIKHCDEVMLATEKRDLMRQDGPAWLALPAPMVDTIDPWSPQVAEASFMQRLGALSGTLAWRQS